MTEAVDPQLRRVERGAAAVFGLALLAALASGGGMRAALGVAAGGLLVAVSYRAIAGGVDALVGRAIAQDVTSSGPSTTWRLVKFITRFAILGAIAYVMMVRLRAHPGWMLAGASSLVAAAALEAFRGPRRARH